MKPYGPTGLTTKLWKQQPVHILPVETLIPTQDGVYFASLFIDNPDAIFVVRWWNLFFIEDGHSRWAQAKVRRHFTIRAHLLEME